MLFSLPALRGAQRTRNELYSISLFALLAIGILGAHCGFAQQKSDFAGDYAGMSGPLHVKLHIIVSPDGTISASVDSPDQNIFAVPCSDISVNGQMLSLSVPSVHGEWMGTLSADHNTLSGIWKQGAPMPLTLTRIGGSASGANARPVTPTAQPPTTPKNVGSQHPPCGSTLGVSYWNGSGWTLMTSASHMGSDEGFNWKKGMTVGVIPGHHYGGVTQIVTFKNSAAALMLDPKPNFCVSILPGFDPTVILIGSLDIKKNRRQLETCTGPCAMSVRRNTDDWMPEKHVQPVDIRHLSATTVEITPKEPLKPGQYLIGGPGLLVAYYDFGVGSMDHQ